MALIELERGNPHLAVEALGLAIDECGIISTDQKRRIIKAKDEADIGNPDRAETLIRMLLTDRPEVTVKSRFKPSRRVDGKLSPTNMWRADRAKDALAKFRGNEEPDEADFADLLCDMMHLAHRDGIDFQKELKRASSNYKEER